MHRIAVFLGLAALVLTTACAPATRPPDRRAIDFEIAALATAIAELGPAVDAEEATRAARIALTYPLELRALYEVEDGPIVHNMKVNAGTKPRGLCWHWAQDLERRMAREDFDTLDLHRAVAPPRNVFRLEHSTLVVSAEGAAMQDGVVLDPWRKGGVLTWMPVRSDPDYDWLPRAQVLAAKGIDVPGLALPPPAPRPAG